MTESVSNKNRGLRRRRPNFEDSSSSWLITYSDAITLLLAFFCDDFICLRFEPG